MADEYRAAADCLRRKAEGTEGEPKTGFLNTFLDGYFYALKLFEQAEADYA
jgi:hypothetical protein